MCIYRRIYQVVGGGGNHMQQFVLMVDHVQFLGCWTVTVCRLQQRPVGFFCKFNWTLGVWYILSVQDWAGDVRIHQQPWVWLHKSV